MSLGRRAALAFLALAVSAWGGEGKWGGFVPPSDKALLWSGRVDFSQPGRARMSWSQSGFSAEFDGSAVTLYLEPQDNNFNLFIDGRLQAILGPKPKDRDIPNYKLWIKPQKHQVQSWVIGGLKRGRHRLELAKRTSANFGEAAYFGLRFNSGARLLPAPPAPTRRLEFIGDSLTNAYGCEGPSRNCVELRPYENGHLSYAALCARRLRAALQVLAVSGYGVVRNYGSASRTSPDPMPSFYPRVLMGQAQPPYERSRFMPDAIVINLGTNDFSTEPIPTRLEFLEGYARLLDMALEGRRGRPVFIISVVGREIQETRTEEAYRRAKAAGLNVTLVKFEKAGDDELGCDWHPLARVHERWARGLEDALKPKLGW